MGFMDLSTSVASKKHVDFNDARYQLSEKLRQSGKQTARATFTLYDNKETNKIAVHDITAAYALSDKRLPIGELLNKIVDLILDMEDGILHTEKDVVYSWKYSVALLEMYEDKRKRQEKLSMFDNGLKNSIINSPIFINRYPGKYTNRTNFFDPKIKSALEEDIITTFKEISLPEIHKAAKEKSRELAEKHSNPIMDKIVQWAVDNYGCSVDSFYEVTEDAETGLCHSTNTVILHLKNGYDMSIIGYVGTDHDDQFAMSIFDAKSISIEKHGEKISQNELQDMLTEVAHNAPVDPIAKLLNFEREKNKVLKEQYEILTNIRPMVPANVLELKAAETVVGRDYIWGCKIFREDHEDLPTNFKLEDVELPQWIEEEENDESMKKQSEMLSAIGGVAEVESEKKIESVIDEILKDEQIETEEEVAFKAAMLQMPSQDEDVETEEEDEPVDINNDMNIPQLFGEDAVVDSISLANAPSFEDLFDLEEERRREMKFGDLSRFGHQAEIWNFNNPSFGPGKNREEQKYDPTTTLLPGFAPVKAPQEEENILSVTSEAQQVPEFEEEKQRLFGKKKIRLSRKKQSQQRSSKKFQVSQRLCLMI